MHPNGISGSIDRQCPEGFTPVAPQLHPNYQCLWLLSLAVSRTAVEPGISLLTNL
jgi:hypothetical protein